MMDCTGIAQLFAQRLLCRRRNPIQNPFKGLLLLRPHCPGKRVFSSSTMDIFGQRLIMMMMVQGKTTTYSSFQRDL